MLLKTVQYLRAWTSFFFFAWAAAKADAVADAAFHLLNLNLLLLLLPPSAAFAIASTAVAVSNAAVPAGPKVDVVQSWLQHAVARMTSDPT